MTIWNPFPIRSSTRRARKRVYVLCHKNALTWSWPTVQPVRKKQPKSSPVAPLS